MADFIRNVGNRTDVTTASTLMSTTVTLTAATSHQRPNSAPLDGSAHDTIRKEHNCLFGYRPPALTQARQLHGIGTS